jgi:hypothetical protein
MSDYGRSTGRIIGSFVVLAIVFAVLYWLCPNCIVVDGQAVNLHCPLRATYLSIVTMISPGLGNIDANQDSWLGQCLLVAQAILSYVLLGSLVTRFAVLFVAGGPVGKFSNRCGIEKAV